MLQKLMHYVLTNEWNWSFEGGRAAVRVLWKHYHFKGDHFYVWVKLVPLNCQNMRSNLNFVSFYFLWPDFGVASWPHLRVPGYRRLSGRRKDLFCSSGSVSLGGWGDWGGDWSDYSHWTRMCSRTLTGSFYPMSTLMSPSISNPSTFALKQQN